METLIKILLALLFISILIFLCSRNKSEWKTQNHYPRDSGWYEIQDLESEKIQDAYYKIGEGWGYTKGQPKHFKWRKLND